MTQNELFIDYSKNFKKIHSIFNIIVIIVIKRKTLCHLHLTAYTEVLQNSRRRSLTKHYDET